MTYQNPSIITEDDDTVPLGTTILSPTSTMTTTVSYLLMGRMVVIAAGIIMRMVAGGKVWILETTDGGLTTTADAGLVVEKVAMVAVAMVPSFDNCATKVPGAGPCCDGHPLYDGHSYDGCGQVCDWLLMCDGGYVPVPFLTDDAATRYPETSNYQPDNCNCRGYEDHNGCFCRQVRDMIEHVVDYETSAAAIVGPCFPCLSPPPTPPPTLPPTPPPTTLYDPSQDYCFTDKDNVGKYCWSPIDLVPYHGNWEGDGKHGNNNCGPMCTDNYDPNRDFCFADKDNAGKYCWCDPFDCPKGSCPYGNWKFDGWHGNDNCGSKCNIHEIYYCGDYHDSN